MLMGLQIEISHGKIIAVGDYLVVECEGGNVLVKVPLSVSVKIGYVIILKGEVDCIKDGYFVVNSYTALTISNPSTGRDMYTMYQ